jgi:cytochrome c oxidase assembly protein subunit 15
MSFGEFKSIYWWEWSHRQLGRLLGLAFFVPLIVFWLRGAVNARLAARLAGIGVLGGLQGAIGWIMVASGLEAGMVAVAPIKLALHLTVASIILALIVAVAAGLRDEREPARELSAPGLRRSSYVLVGLVLMQIALGGLVAGSHAGFTYNTWPLMDGHLLPGAGDLFAVTPWYENLVDNPLLVQFDHRGVAYAIVLFALWHAWSAWRTSPGSAFAGRATGVAAIALCQMVLGITTLLLVVPLWAGLAHQLLAMGLLAMATVHARLSAATAASAEIKSSAAHALA